MPAKDLPLTHNLRPGIRRPSPLHRFVLIATLLILSIALVALTACGSESDDNSSTPIPPPTSAPDPTPPPATAESAPVPASGSGTEELFVLAMNYQIMELNLTAGDTARIAYSSFGRSSGGITEGGPFAGREGAGSAEGDVILTVVNPVEDQILNEDPTVNNTVAFQAELSGAYHLVFSNPYRLQGLDVTVDYTINP